jgi:cell division septal protein FtsQ
MTERRVRAGRQVYGRAIPLRQPGGRMVRRPRLSVLQQRLIVLAAVVLLVAWGLGRLFAITKVTVQAPARASEIREETQKLMAVSWQRRNMLTLNSGALATDIEQADPLLRSVDVRRQWLHGVRVTATLKQPSLGWASGNQRYLLDRDGTVIGQLPDGSSLPVVNDGSNLPVAVGKRVVSSHFVAFANEVVTSLHDRGISVSSMDVAETTLDLSVTTNKGYRLVFDTGREVLDEMTDLDAVLKLLAAQHKAPADYIDLRVAGKAYYK